MATAIQDVSPMVGGALVRLTRAGDAAGAAVAAELESESRKGIEKSAAIRRLIGTVNPETGREHSASSAEKVVESDETYAAFLAQCRANVVARIRAWTDYDVAKLEARLAVRLAAARAGDE